MSINSDFHGRRPITEFDWDSPSYESDNEDTEDTSIYDKRPTFNFDGGGSYTG